jgi:hypothetical protein
MNKKQKLLTIVALVVFIAIGALHYLQVEKTLPINTPGLGARMSAGYPATWFHWSLGNRSFSALVLHSRICV